MLLTSSGLKPRVLLNALKHISTHYNKKTPSLKCHMQRLRNPDLDDQMFLEQKYQKITHLLNSAMVFAK